MPDAKPIKIFKAGRRKAKNGKSYDFTEQMVKDIVASYDPALHEAPLVIGHPKEDAPAYGWVQKLQFAEDGVMSALPAQVDPEFAEIVNAGRYKKISVALYPPDDENNPTPGKFYLRHVGFFGAQPTAVKGIGSASFQDNDDAVVEIEFAEFMDYGDMSIARALRSLKNFLIEKFGKEAADDALPEWNLEDAATTAAQEEPNKPASPHFSDPHQEHHTMTPEELAQKEREIQQREQAVASKETEFSERERTLTTKEREQRHAGHVEFCESLIKDGKLLPAEKDGAVAFMDGLADDQKVEFGEGESAVNETGVSWFKKFLGGLEKRVEFGEAGNGGDADVDNDNAQDIAKRAVEFQESEKKAGRTITIATAVAHVTKGDK